MSFLNYVLGPKLFMEYGFQPGQKLYEPTGLEKIGDQIISTLSLMWNIGYYTSPLIVTLLYRRGYFVTESISSLAKITTSIGIIFVLSLCVRGFGRTQSHSYAKLVKALELAKTSKTSDGKKALRRFDIEFSSWPVDFDVSSIEGDGSKKRIESSVHRRDTRIKQQWYSTLPCEIAAYIAIHTFGIRMIYPGSVKLLQSYLRPMLIDGRAKLIEKELGQRYKIKTLDNNEIDTVFIDRRNDGSNGKTLVICSEGNAGFYEIGIMSTPVYLNYSVIGWNHPGFEGSTGQPYPDQDKNAIDAVIQFAIHHLDFSVESIILYGWSIGGFSSLWAGTSYPDVKGIILDATFDDILYLAQPRMPSSLSGIVKIAIRDYVNLNNVEMISKYNGPILLIRRTEDEIIAEDNRLDTNRGNFLALHLLKYRYPNIFKSTQINRAKNLLSKPLENTTGINNDDEKCLSRFIMYSSGKSSFPMDIGKDYTEDVRDRMADFLLRKHFIDYKSTHCTPLPADFFIVPWRIP